MGLLNSISLANGLSQAGAAAGKIGEDWGRSLLEQDKIKLADQLAAAREETGDYRRAKITEEGDIRRADLQEKAAIAAAEREPIIAGKRRRSELEVGLEFAPKLTDAEVDKQTKLAAAATTARVAEFEKMAPLERQKRIEEARALAELYNDPKITAALRKKALAEHIVDPHISFMPLADGTIAGFDTRSGKSTGVLKGDDGKPLEVRDPAQMAAANKLLDNANVELREARNAYAISQKDLDPDARAQGTAAWKAAQERIANEKTIAVALMSGKVKAGAPISPSAAPSIVDPFAPKGSTVGAAAPSGRLTPEQVAERNAEIQRVNSLGRDPNADANAASRQAAAAAAAEQRRLAMLEEQKRIGFINSRLTR